MEQIRIIEVKDFHPDYVEKVNRLLKQLTSSDGQFTDIDLKEMIASSNSHLFLLFLEEEVAGMLSVGAYKTPTGWKYWVEDVVVDHQFRGKSLGKKLIEYAIGYVCEQKNAALMLTSNPKRVAANQLYQSVGFQQKQTNVYKMTFQETHEIEEGAEKSPSTFI